MSYSFQAPDARPRHVCLSVIGQVKPESCLAELVTEPHYTGWLLTLIEVEMSRPQRDLFSPGISLKSRLMPARLPLTGFHACHDERFIKELFFS